ncbi:MAG: MoaD/ThiS family protein [Desulfobacterales bacterium]|jgi:molybdopterin converting factor small subunit
MKSHIQVKLFATLQPFTPPSGEKYRIDPGISIRSLLEQLNLPEEKAKLIFIDGIKANLSSTLNGGERVGIFPPVGGG